MAAPQGWEGFHRVSLSSSDSGQEQSESETEPCGEALPMEMDEVHSADAPIRGRFPADTPIAPPVVGLSHKQFCNKVMDQTLPGDGYGRASFDTFPTFVVGDPSARFDTHTPLTYETTGELGHPIWKDIFRHILKECSYLTAFDTVDVMVDTRNLRAHGSAQDGLPHWPAAVAWWHSRLQLVGPQNEKTELLFSPATEQTGLHTFALAALVVFFPGINFILLDSDCLPVTLFEAADLWKEAYLTRFPPGTGKALPKKHPLHRRRAYVSDSKVVYTQQRVNENTMGQGVLLVTEPHSELNAGLVVIFGASHPPLLNWVWTHRCRCLPDSHQDDLLSTQAEDLEGLFLSLMGDFLQRTLTERDLTPVEKQYWIQSGLALSPLIATCTQYSIDFCLASALIGEWTSRILFPVPKGPWPRHGHAGALLPEYQARSPRIVAWARASFEQGALPSLLLLQGTGADLHPAGRQNVSVHCVGYAKEGNGLRLCTPTVGPKLVWHKHCGPLQVKAGCL